MTKNKSYKALSCIILLGVMILFNSFFVNAGVTGGTITTDGDYTVHTFFSNGTFNWTGENTNVTILLVGGGGAGAGQQYIGGGGGAGGLIYNQSYNMVAGFYNITIGSGGIGSSLYGGNGTNTTLQAVNPANTLIAWGGGGGGGYNGGAGMRGGSGGGGNGGAGNSGGIGVVGQGYNGSSGKNGNIGGGGGGSSQYAGTNGGGGNGTEINISNGTLMWYAGGGGGGASGTPPKGAGGKGGGGAGGEDATLSAENGTANTGGGGGGIGETPKSGGWGGSGIVIIRYLTGSDSSNININLVTPSNGSLQLNSEINFTTTLNINGTNYSYQWKNATYKIWFNNGTQFNSTLIIGLSGNSTSFSRNISIPNINNYLWNTYACYGNATLSNCSWGTNNFTFLKGSSINIFNYSTLVYETSLEQFYANLSLAEEAEISLIQLQYNGTNYTISNFTMSNGFYLIETKINIPLNINDSLNQTNTFYLRFTYNGNFIQSFGPYTQNSTIIKLIQCNAIYNVRALNFTFYDETSQIIINTVTNKSSIASNFKYWLGDGSIYKNYSFQNLTSTINTYSFCIYPYASNITFKTNVDIEYSALTYRENKYYLRNSTLTNISNNISLYLLSEDIATKFFLAFKQGIRAIRGGTVNVQKYFTGLGQFQTVAILLTDDDGKATMWQDIDKTYRYSVVEDNSLLGVIDRVSICSATPCAMTLMIDERIGDSFQAYDEYYAQNVLSNISFTRATNMVNYNFIDITGLAHYFRFEVKQTNINGTDLIICNTTSYSVAGSLSCNVTGYKGDFLATGYISRSPEKVDKILSFLIDEDILENLGSTGLFLVMILIITICIAGAVLSRGNPSTILFLLGITLLGLKIIKLFPFSWVTTVVLEVLIVWMMFKIKT